MTTEVHELALRFPDRPALILDDATTIDFATLDRRVDALAGWLQTVASVGPGDVVALMATNRPEWVETFQAALRIGARLVPVNWHLQADDAGYVIADAEATVLIVEDQFAATVAAAPAHTLRLGADYEAALAEARPVDRDRPRGSLMVYTSGTTGRPKGVRQDGPSTAAGAEIGAAMVAMFGLDADRGDTMLCPAPLYHSGPSRICCEWPLGAGAAVVLMERFDPRRALELIEEHGISHAFFVPTMFQRMLAVPDRDRFDVSSLRFVLHGAGPCSRSVKEEMFEWFGPVIHEMYAASEGPGTWITPEEWLAHPGSVGRADPSRMEIRDGDGRRADAGAEGVVWFAATAPFRYHGDPEKTAATFDVTGEWYTVGDRGRIDAEGYLFLTGRSAEVVVVGGVNVYPARIDEVLAAHPDVVDGAGFGLPDEEMGEVVAVAVVPRPGVDPDDVVERVRAACRRELGSQMTPRRVFVVDELPRSDAGKLYRRRLVDRFS